MAAAETYDHIVIGAGSAGCVVANRLSADPDRKVLLLEAGGKDSHPLVRLPMLMGKLMHSGIYNWAYHTEPEPEFDDREVYWPRGKALGGSSTINGMIYVRGNRADYDRWAQMGNPGWSYAEVLPYFRKSESHVERADDFHGSDGPLTVCRARGDSPLFDRFIEAGVEAGYARNDDFNGAVQEGFGRYDFTIRDGKRWSTSRAFLRPAMKRPNLTVATHALTRRIVIDKGRAVGVEYERGGETIVARASREIVLSAGAVNAPQVLMLSGIGDRDELREHGIETVHHLPGVGKNLQDHVDVCLIYEVTRPVTLYSELRVDRLTRAVIEGTLFGRGIATTFPYEGGAFVRSRPGLEAPDIQAHFMPALEKTANLHWPKLFDRARVEDNHGVTIRVGPVNPESRGRITLRSADPRDPPRIFANYLATQFDKDTTIAGVRIIREVMAQPAFADILGAEIAPGADRASDEDLAEWLKQAGGTTLHPVGTCKMGNDDNAVVDAELRVHGIAGLRVADASIMPVIASGNTNAPTIMIGEKAADMVLKATS
ncbi:MAG: choline dehydrogenase [Bauldia sp.]|uniref:GMC family oxidoreductase n=1 Tax=Bauldia sp. TaxID=2575872 RepID=UPI001D3B068D|nr:choline dehydrogenase [Bauldia sp.]MCB1497941.1 choline dehydrogenase [Bauldia sp.]